MMTPTLLARLLPRLCQMQVCRFKLTKVDHVVEGFGFNDNAAETGFFIIPPDPHGAVGNSRVIAIGNVIIECRNRGGQLKWRDALRDFFAPLSPTTLTFDPKIIYDQYEDRFVAVTLEQVTGTASVSPTNISRILVAVSKTASQTPTRRSLPCYQRKDARKWI